MAGGAQTGEVYTPAYYSENLYNHDLAPLKDRFWGWYQVFCMWMSDVHSVGGYLFAASLFALGLAGWQVFICLIVGIVIVMYLTNWVARPGVDLGVPYPVVCRLSFGVFGANIAAIIRGLIAIAWYGIQTYVASKALIVVVLKFFPQYAVYETMHFLGLSYLGWFAFLDHVDLPVPGVLPGHEGDHRVHRLGGPGRLRRHVPADVLDDLQGRLGQHQLHPGRGEVQRAAAFWQMIVATALVISYFSGPMVNFSDFSRFSRTCRRRSRRATSGACRSTSWPSPSSP